MTAYSLLPTATNLCVSCGERPAKWHPLEGIYGDSKPIKPRVNTRLIARDCSEDTPQFCTQRCAAVWGHRRAEADNLSAEYSGVPQQETDRMAAIEGFLMNLDCSEGCEAENPCVTCRAWEAISALEGFAFGITRRGVHGDGVGEWIISGL